MSGFHINSFWISSHHEKLCTPNLKISIFLKVYVNKIQSFWDKADSRNFLFGKYYLPKVVNWLKTIVGKCFLIIIQGQPLVYDFRNLEVQKLKRMFGKVYVMRRSQSIIAASLSAILQNCLCISLALMPNTRWLSTDVAQQFNPLRASCL